MSAALMLLLAVLIPNAFGQTTAGPASVVEIESHKPLKANVKWTGDVVIGSQLDSGRLDQRMISLTGSLWKVDPKNTFRFDLSHLYGSIKPQDAKIVSVDRQYAGFAWTHPLTPKYYYMQLDYVDRDHLLLIDHRETSIHLIGFRVLKGRKVSLDLGPGVAVVYQDKNVPVVDGFQFSVGGFYSIVYKVDERWTLSQWSQVRSNTQYIRDTVLDSTMSLMGKITKNIGLNVKIAYNYDGVLTPLGILQGYSTKNYLSTVLGANIHF
jgi:putative salt-induced outer membrane protein YdiY